MTLPDLRLRPMQLRDLETVIGIEREIYPFPWTSGNFRDSLLSGYSCWVCEKAGPVVAYGVVMLAADEAHVLNIGVARDWQRRGIGRALMEHLVGVARDYGAATVFLEVRPSNGPALRLYERMGFNEIGVRKNYYPAAKGREDAIVMGLQL
ncbi:MAG: ribosomal protein S18-alanine N-acetyltransferase [Betaproteobacteria bacterium]|nr:ribosomal protein S18-alanine N-acetyltransferase [Betaproteobacteria bacterium]